MNTIDYHKVGEEFENNGRKFVTIDTCELCDMKDGCFNSVLMSCTPESREDNRYVIYKEVNKRKEMGTLLLRIISILFLVVCAVLVIFLFLHGLYLFGMMFMLCCLFVMVDAWVNGRRSK